MGQPLHRLPEAITLSASEYRLQHAALETALDVLDRAPEADPDGTSRQGVEAALRLLLQKIWPYLGDLDEEA